MAFGFIEHAVARRLVAAAGALIALLIVVDYILILIRRRKLPPGPLPLPLFGNTLSYPKSKPWLMIERLSKTYDSPIITFWVGRTPGLWLNDAWSASELLEKRAKNYCSRPHQVVLGDLVGGHTNMVSMYYGERWRLHRKITHSAVGLQQMQSIQPFQEDESKVTAMNLLSDPNQYDRHFQRFAASVVSIVGTGSRCASIDDPLITDVLATATEAGESIVPGKGFPIIMETFPILASFPPLRMLFRSLMDKGRNLYVTMAERAALRPFPSLAKQVWTIERPAHDLSEPEVAALVGNLFGAGTDTSSSTLCTFALACAAFPAALPRAWAELDTVVGPHRSPKPSDLAELPYTAAFVRELFRWRPVSVMGGQPHAPLQDDTFGRHSIPAGTSITGNLWAIHHNERDFPRPHEFCPGRHFEDHELNRPFPNEKGYMAFGWGRRVCSGQALAEQGTRIMVARLLWGFRVEAKGTAKLDTFDYTSGVAIKPRPFGCSFTVRNDEIRRTIEREGMEALRALEKFNVDVAEGEDK